MQARYQATLQPEQKRGHKDPRAAATQVFFWVRRATAYLTARYGSIGRKFGRAQAASRWAWSANR